MVASINYRTQHSLDKRDLRFFDPKTGRQLPRSFAEDPDWTLSFDVKLETLDLDVTNWITPLNTYLSGPPVVKLDLRIGSRCHAWDAVWNPVPGSVFALWLAMNDWRNLFFDVLALGAAFDCGARYSELRLQCSTRGDGLQVPELSLLDPALLASNECLVRSLEGDERLAHVNEYHDWLLDVGWDQRARDLEELLNPPLPAAGEENGQYYDDPYGEDSPLYNDW